MSGCAKRRGRSFCYTLRTYTADESRSELICAGSGDLCLLQVRYGRVHL